MAHLPVPSLEPLWRPVEGNPNAIEVNLAFSPKRPFRSAEVDWCWGPQTGWVLVEHKENALFVAGKKVAHHLEPEQTQRSSFQGNVLFFRLQAKMAGVVLHPNIKTALLANKQLFPESWKTDDQGRRLLIFFWAVGFRRGQSRRYVEYVVFLDGVWHGYCNDLDYLWYDCFPAAYVS